MKIKINDIELNYEMTGHGPDVILLNGFGGNLSYWHNQVSVLSKDFRLITFDQRGCGLSGRPKSVYGYQAMVEDLLALLGALGIQRAHLVGFSQGGRVAIHFTSRYPEMVKSLTMVCSSLDFSSEDKPERAAKADNLIKLLKTDGVDGFACNFTDANFSPGFRNRSPEVWSRYCDMVMTGCAETMIRTIESDINDPLPPPQLENIACPVMFIWGEHDLTVSRQLRDETMKRMPYAEHVTFPVGHSVATELPEAFNLTVRDFFHRSETTA